ncbi:LADA_0E00848g1_1 [Lachancea dasiensis]|uniref:LADA_0E00848g1_1 n=1 Tax=Lachancea dasiensis TaxID=1072105 RepID=A0A1G4JA35_9SACH|nr:LADA_0E00848g1_1 [Lachancea dasiensis]
MDEEELELKRRLMEAKVEELARRKRLRKNENELSGTKRQVKKNCAIYISNLPLEGMDKEKLVSEFGRFGIIRKDPANNEPKCKMYKDDNGNFKGDALILYLKPESVEIAVQLMDGVALEGSKLKVEEAVFTPATGKTEKNEEGLAKLKRSNALKIKEQEHELNDWSDADSLSENSDNSSMTPSRNSLAEEASTRIVVLTNVLDLYESLRRQELLEIESDLKAGCSAVGELLDFELDEVLGQVRAEYATEESAQQCCKTMDGRYFDGRKLNAYILSEESKEDTADV